MPVAKKPQLAFDDDVLENEALANQLERWQEAKGKLAPLLEHFRTLDAAAKSEIKQMGLEPGEHRCGKFIISISDKEPKEVSFERRSGTTIRIRSPKGDDE